MQCILIKKSLLHFQGLKLISCALVERYVFATNCIQLLDFNLPKDLFFRKKRFLNVRCDFGLCFISYLLVYNLRNISTQEELQLSINSRNAGLKYRLQWQLLSCNHMQRNKVLQIFGHSLFVLHFQ